MLYEVITLEQCPFLTEKEHGLLFSLFELFVQIAVTENFTVSIDDVFLKFIVLDNSYNFV